MNEQLKAFRKFQAADRKFRKGDSLTDPELNLLIANYTIAYEGVRAISQESYKLVENDVRSRLTSLQGFRFARDELRTMKVIK